jgi:DNA invertase Pin-like site-specific DNA recombinase
MLMCPSMCQRVVACLRTSLGRDEHVFAVCEGIDTSNTTGRMVARVLASLAELELELGRERRAAARDARKARGQSIGRPKAKVNAALVNRLARGPRECGGDVGYGQ